MIVIKSIQELKRYYLEYNLKDIGFVPTMGCLHKGHESLIQKSKKENSFTIVSIFVNPAQFNNKDDLINYPSNINRDLEICKNELVDLLFIPEIKEIYPNGIPNLIIQYPPLMNQLCAKTRPGHFDGVLLVVSILFNLIQPTVAYFGLKDYQQYLLVKHFFQLTHSNIHIIGAETIRETDGLAFSSRNSRLSNIDRKNSSIIFKTLLEVKNKILNSKPSFLELYQFVNDSIKKYSFLIDYFEILDPNDLTEKKEFYGDIFLGIAVYCNHVRLIDNLIFHSP